LNYRQMEIESCDRSTKPLDCWKCIFALDMKCGTPLLSMSHGDAGIDL
jgi:hypothetical protein